jgi:hypothetical protein
LCSPLASAARERSTSKALRTAVDQVLVAALLLACVLFAVAVWIAPPASTAASAPARSVELAQTSSAYVARGVVMHPLALPRRIADVDLSAMPDRLANEAAPSAWRRVITVRGIPGVASVESPAVVAWTELGIAYRLLSPTRSTEDLIAIADELR